MTDALSGLTAGGEYKRVSYVHERQKVIEDLLNSVISRRDMTSSEKLVLVVIGKEQAGRSYAKLSRKEIGDRCGLSEATVKRAVIDLAARGMITCRRSKITPDYNDRNTYRVIWVNNFNRRRNWLRREQFAEQMGS